MEARTIHERIRAWVLVQAEQPHDLAKAIYAALGHDGGNEWVVVRADVVTGCPYDIIIPVDAAHEDALQVVRGKIEAEVGHEVVVARVEKHFPYPPHDAQGYITTQEVEDGRLLVDKPGRQGTSPGPNPFG